MHPLMLRPLRRTLFLLALMGLLAACGAPDTRATVGSQPNIAPVRAAAGTAYPAPQSASARVSQAANGQAAAYPPPATSTPLPIVEQTAAARWTAQAQREADRDATTLALPPLPPRPTPTMRVGPTPIPPYVIPMGGGFLYPAGGSKDLARDMQNAWKLDQGTQTLIVQAGGIVYGRDGIVGKLPTPIQGVLEVVVRQAQTEPEIEGKATESSFQTPTRDGSARIVNARVDGAAILVTITTEGGSWYTFNARDGSFQPAPRGGAFPALPVLDPFDRADGLIGGQWQGDVGGYTIRSQRALVLGGGLITDQRVFGADQEAYVTLPVLQATAEEIDLILKAQGSGICDLLEVWYQPTRNTVQVQTCQNDVWTQQGADIPLTLHAGDRFGARAFADGTVQVFQNATLIGSVQVASTWPYRASGGRIGLWTISASTTVLDDFGGGTLTLP